MTPGVPWNLAAEHSLQPYVDALIEYDKAAQPTPQPPSLSQITCGHAPPTVVAAVVSPVHVTTSTALGERARSPSLTSERIRSLRLRAAKGPKYNDDDDEPSSKPATLPQGSEDLLRDVTSTTHSNDSDHEVKDEAYNNADVKAFAWEESTYEDDECSPVPTDDLEIHNGGHLKKVKAFMTPTMRKNLRQKYPSRDPTRPNSPQSLEAKVFENKLVRLFASITASFAPSPSRRWISAESSQTGARSLQASEA